MPKITKEKIVELRKLCEKATPGPWELDKEIRRSEGYVHYVIRSRDKLPQHPWSQRFIAWMMGSLGEALHNRQPNEYRDDPEIEHDATLIAAARTALPDLLSVLEEAWRERDEYKHIRDTVVSLVAIGTGLTKDAVEESPVSAIRKLKQRAESAERALAGARQGCPICRRGALGSDGYIKTDGAQYVSFRCASCSSLFLSDCTRERWLALPAPPEVK